MSHAFASAVAIVVALLAAAGAGGRQDGCLPPVPTDPHGSYIVPGAESGIVYRRVGGRSLALDAWVPPGGRPVPPVVVVHGGGFVAGSRVAFVGQFLEMLTDAGYAWFSIDYRLDGPGRRANAVDDVREAVRFVQCRAGELGVDGNRVVLLGEDSGASLALEVARERPTGVVGAALVGGTFPSWPGPSSDAVLDRAVPLLFVHGTDDREQPPGVVDAWCARRRAQGARCEFAPVEGASHRAENWWPSQWGYKANLVAWLRDIAPAAAAPRILAPQSRTDTPARLAPGLHKRLVYAPEQGLTLDAWVQPDSNAPSTAVIIVHGGGWEAGDRVTYVPPLFEPLARAGFAWFSIDYRLTPSVTHPEQLEDVRRALQYVRREADRFGIDPRRLVLLGESASGQMAMLVAASESGLAGVVSFYGVYDLEALVSDASPRSLLVRLFGPQPLDDRARARLREYSPLHRARAGMPPLLLIHGTNERLWEQGTRMAARLDALGVPHVLVRLDGAPHGLENWEGRPEWQFYKERLVQWIRDLRGADTALRASGPVSAAARSAPIPFRDRADVAGAPETR